MMSEFKFERFDLGSKEDINFYPSEKGQFCKAEDVIAELATAQAENERLKAQLAETWQPVADGEVIHCACGEVNCFNVHTVTLDGSVLESEDAGITLGNLRLCRKAATVAAE